MEEFINKIMGLSKAQLMVLAVKQQEKLLNTNALPNEPIAVIGIGCRFPRSADRNEFWKNLSAGESGMVRMKNQRWDMDELYDPDPDAPGKINSPAAGLLDDVDGFDAELFGIVRREAEAMDPQHRLLLEVAWEALEDSGHPYESLSGSRTGVFVGISNNDYARLFDRIPLESITAYAGIGNSFSAAAGRIAYLFGFQGPALAVDTACSSSLVGVHLACQSLRNGESNLALAGGVNLLLAPEASISFSKAHMLAADGLCKVFDAAADGYVRGEGCGVVVLKRLADALEAGDPIHAVIRGSAVNQDGRSQGLTAPNGPAQESLIQAALASGGLSPADIHYVEAHGTGTALGDPIEAGALGRVFGASHGPGRPLLVGTVKSNIGHLEAAAGVAGLIKAALAVKHGEVPPSLHFREPNPHIDWADSPVRVPTERTPWPAADGPRRAGVSAFGFSGTNAHVVVEQAPPPPARPAAEAERPRQLLVLSAKSAAALRALAERYAARLAAPDAGPWPDICHTALIGRAHFRHRLALAAADPASAAALLAAHLRGEAPAGLAHGEAPARPPRIAFLFTGQGSQHPGMGEELYRTQPRFRRTLDRCAALLAPRWDRPLAEVLWGRDTGRLDETRHTQAALFALEYALADLWRSWGLEPALVMGHSVGEYAAACLAGVFSLEDGLTLVDERARLMDQLAERGGMAAVLAPAAAVLPHLAGHPRVALAAENGPDHHVISGDRHAVEAIGAALRAAGHPVQPLAVSHAFHSPLVEPALGAFAEAARRIAYHPPRLGLVSNLTGAPIGPEIARADYWIEHARAPVRFQAGMAALAAGGAELYLEVGPQPVLIGMGRRCLPDAPADAWWPSLRKGAGAWDTLLAALAAAYVRGARIDARAFDAGYGPRRLPLPTYPFQRQRHWIDAPARRAASGRPAPAGDWRDWLYGVAWEERARLGRSRPGDYAPPPRELAGPLRAHLAGLVDGPAMAGYRAGLVELETLAYGYVARAFLEMGWPFPPGERLSVESAAARLGVVPAHHRLLGRLLGILAEEGVLRRDGAAWTVVGHPAPVDAAARQRALAERHPENGAELALLGRCGPRLAGVLRGECDPLELIFPQGDFALAGALYQDAPGFRALNTVLREALRRIAEALPRDRGLRVLELGAGTGSTTAYLLPLLPPDRTEYVFTDVSGLFLTKAQRTFRDHPFVQYRLLDIEQSPAVQGFDLHQYDIVVASNVLHATRDLRQSLRHARSLLAPHGLLALFEGTRPQRWIDLIFGLTEGWWRFADTDVRPDYPMVSTATWRTLLAECGFEQTEALVPGSESEGVAPAVLLSRADGQGAATGPAGRWLLLMDGQGTGEELAAALRGPGEPCVLAWPGDGFARLDEWSYRLDPTDPAQLARLLELPGPPWRGVVHLGPLDAPEPGTPAGGDLDQALAHACRTSLALVQAMAATGQGAALWLVTRGAQPVAGGPVAGLAQSPLWGMGKVIAMEHPELRCARVDLDPDAAGPGPLPGELLGGSAEDQVAFRGGRRLVARLTRHISKPVPQSAGPVAQADAPYKLEIGRPGALDDLRIVPQQRREPGAGEVEVRVRAAGLNFIDVLDTLGMLPFQRLGGLGVECAGDVVAVGAGVTDFKVGDAVMGVAPGSFSEFTTVSADWLVRKPDRLSFEEAATIPSNFITAYYALRHVAKVSPGDRVLVHAAAGGTGFAAVQVAQAVGAEVYGTASPGKWDFLKASGVKHVMNSRTLDFADGVSQATQGRGIDVVFNSLAGEFIPKSMAALAKGGRFVEIGKRGIWSAEQAGQLRPDVQYSIVDAMSLAIEQPRTIKALLADIMREMDAGKLRPLPFQAFPITDATSAFRTMQLAKHTGKIVLTMPTPEGGAAASPRIRSDVTYLITGGIGGLGLLVARWMAERGARHIALVSRREADPAALDQIREVEALGAEVRVLVADVARPGELAAALAEVEAHMPPLRGVIHSVGVLDDGALVQQTWPRFAKVFAPKVNGAWHLHALTLGRDLDFFVLFSGAVAMVGNPGQANHAAANAFQDALAGYRRANGLPATSINWGAWSEVGAAARRHGLNRRLGVLGVGEISPTEGLAAFEYALATAPTQIGVLPVDWRRALAQFPASAFFERMKPAQPTVAACASENFMDRLVAAPAQERRPLLIEHVRSMVATVLGYEAGKIDIHKGFADLGIDSLTAVELKNLLEKTLACKLPAVLFFNSPNVSAVVDHLMTESLPPELFATETADASPLVSSEIEAQLLKELQELENIM